MCFLREIKAWLGIDTLEGFFVVAFWAYIYMYKFLWLVIRSAAGEIACNVFGNPITNSTLKGMPEYVSKEIKRLDRARVALNMKNTENKDVNARQYVENLKKSWGDGMSTLCLIYNATGDTVRFVMSRDWQGHIGPSPPPQLIANGQWGGFLHVQNSGYGHTKSSAAAVVYRGKNEYGIYCDWMLAWSNNPWDGKLGNKAYTEINEANHSGDVWRTVSGCLGDCGVHRSEIWKGCLSTVITGSGTSPIFEGIITLEDA